MFGKKEEDIISIDFQGWPVYKLTYREILEELGFEHKDGKYQIADNSELLDRYPLCLTDDGMGYGVDEKYITTVNPDGNLFIEKALSKEQFDKLRKEYLGDDNVENNEQKEI